MVRKSIAHRRNVCTLSSKISSRKEWTTELRRLAHACFHSDEVNVWIPFNWILNYNFLSCDARKPCTQWDDLTWHTNELTGIVWNFHVYKRSLVCNACARTVYWTQKQMAILLAGIFCISTKYLHTASAKWTQFTYSFEFKCDANHLLGPFKCWHHGRCVECFSLDHFSG